MPLILPSNSISAVGGFAVDNSLRFDDGSSDYLSRTPSSTGNTKKFTISFWCKRSALGTDQDIFHVYPGSGERSQILFSFDDTLQVELEAANVNKLVTSRVFRDPSAWMHIVVVYDSDNGTSGNRVILYVNGVRETSFSTETYPSSGSTSGINTTTQHEISSYDGAGYYYDGYLAEFVLLDGIVADPTSFGEFDEDTGIWKPIDVSGLTFGTNGFYLDFENSGSLGADVSGNGNNFTVNNLTSIDQTTDTPTNNYATMNPLDYTPYGTATTYSNGNVQVTTGAGTDWTTRYSFSNFAVGTGKWYVECKVSNVGTSNQFYIGVIKDRQTATINSSLGGIANGYGYYANSGDINNNGSGLSTGNSYTTNDIIGMALDLDNGTLDFYKNGVAQGSQVTGLDTNALWQFSGNAYQDSGHQWNFGNPPFTISSGNSDANNYGNFEYSVPSGYYALNTKNLAEFG